MKPRRLQSETIFSIVAVSCGGEDSFEVIGASDHNARPWRGFWSSEAAAVDGSCPDG